MHTCMSGNKTILLKIHEVVKYMYFAQRYMYALIVVVAVGEECMFRQAYDRMYTSHVENLFSETALTDEHKVVTCTVAVGLRYS